MTTLITSRALFSPTFLQSCSRDKAQFLLHGLVADLVANPRQVRDKFVRVRDQVAEFWVANTFELSRQVEIETASRGLGRAYELFTILRIYFLRK